jgi:hypothetical protein
MCVLTGSNHGLRILKGVCDWLLADDQPCMGCAKLNQRAVGWRSRRDVYEIGGQRVEHGAWISECFGSQLRRHCLSLPKLQIANTDDPDPIGSEIPPRLHMVACEKPRSD